MIKWFCSIFLFFIIISCNRKNDVLALYTAEYKMPIIKKPTNPKPVLFLDAGHGGMDSGGVNDSLQLYEKNVTRHIVDEMLKFIDTNKVKVFQARFGDQFTNRHDRIANANKHNPDLYIAIHTNDDRDTTVKGFEISYSDSTIVTVIGKDTIKQKNPNYNYLLDASALLTKKVSAAFPLMKARKIAIRKDDIWVIYAPKYPSILVEFGFISNKSDVATMLNPLEIKKLAQTLVLGIYDILKIKA